MTFPYWDGGQPGGFGVRPKALVWDTNGLEAPSTPSSHIDPNEPSRFEGAESPPSSSPPSPSSQGGGYMDNPRYRSPRVSRVRTCAPTPRALSVSSPLYNNRSRNSQSPDGRKSCNLAVCIWVVGYYKQPSLLFYLSPFLSERHPDPHTPCNHCCCCAGGQRK